MTDAEKDRLFDVALLLSHLHLSQSGHSCHQFVCVEFGWDNLFSAHTCEVPGLLAVRQIGVYDGP